MLHLNRYLYGTVFLTGASVLVLEVAAVRVLSPFYGSSLYVFSSVLTIILAALSLGYWYGGRRADERHSIDDLYRIIAISGLIVLVLLLVSMFVLPLFATDFSVRTGPLIFSLLLFFVPAFLLGIVSPYVIKLQSLNTPSEHIGAVVGGTFFWGTVGSIIGSVATGFWFIPAIGVQQTIVLVSIVLISIGLVVPLFLGRPIRKAFILPIVGIGIALGASIYVLHMADQSQYVYKTDGIYSAIAIRDFEYNDRPARIMQRDTNNSSAIFLDSKELLFPYSQFALFYQELMPNAENFLMLGGGAYTIPRTLTERDPDLEIDVVEIEPVLFELSKEYFDLTDTEHITNYPMDARVYLDRHETKYDIIFADAFGTDTAAPFHLTTLEFYELVKERLNDDGILIMNFIGKPKTVRPSLFGSVTKTLTEVFPNTQAYALQFTDLDEVQNVMFIARKGDKPIALADKTVSYYDGTPISLGKMKLDLSDYDFSKEILLTDDHAPVEYLMAKQR